LVNNKYDKIIIGGGLYGLYAALFCGKRNQSVLVLEYEDSPFKRATYINQARIHMGYHYPRSYSTAIKSANYFDRFVHDYNFCIHESFLKIYATSARFSWTNGRQFEKFCKDANIFCEPVAPEKYFNDGLCDMAFITKEYAFDAKMLKDHFLEKINGCKNIKLKYNSKIKSISPDDGHYKIELQDGASVSAPFVLNAVYASVNQIIDLARFEKFKIKYELCEMILCRVNKALKDVGITVMDGPFFSIMPFGKTEFHSLTSVTFTPHMASYDTLPAFHCQALEERCSPKQLYNCNDCPQKPKSAWDYMNNLTKKYLKDEFRFEYIDSLFSIKPIILASEIDDSRPTVIRKHSEDPVFVSVLSGKINTVYDLDEVLK